MSVVARLLGPRLRVIGLEGAYEKHGLDPQEDALASGRTPASEDWGREPPEMWGVLTTQDERRIETEPGRYQAFYAGVVESLRTGVAPPVDPRDSLAVLRILEAAVRSAASDEVEYAAEPQ
jgi:scyllo-inositol 2-dehydrogenase (NADP+)